MGSSSTVDKEGCSTTVGQQTSNVSRGKREPTMFNPVLEKAPAIRKSGLAYLVCGM